MNANRIDESCAASGVHAHYELRFQSIDDPARSLAFPCDARGEVALDRLSERALSRYLYARVVIGHVYTRPAVHARVVH